jgi:hypothetical protein
VPYNPYQHLVGSVHTPPLFHSPYTSSGLSWTPVPVTTPQMPPVQYQFIPNYTPTNYTPQSRK